MAVDPDKSLSRDELIASLPEVAKRDRVNASRLAAMVLLDTIALLERAACLAQEGQPLNTVNVQAAIRWLQDDVARLDTYFSADVLRALAQVHKTPILLDGQAVIGYQEAAHRLGVSWIARIAMHTDTAGVQSGKHHSKLNLRTKPSAIQPKMLTSTRTFDEFLLLHDQIDAGMFSEWVAVPFKSSDEKRSTRAARLTPAERAEFLAEWEAERDEDSSITVEQFAKLKGIKGDTARDRIEKAEKEREAAKEQLKRRRSGSN